MNLPSIILIFFLCNLSLPAQHPDLKIFIDGKSLDKSLNNIRADAKMGNKYYSILNPKKEIVLHDELIYQDIDLFRFIITEDTLVFTVDKIFEDLKNHPERNKIDELHDLFHTLSKWIVSVDTFSQCNQDIAKSPATIEKPVKGIYKDYKLYSLRTSSFKYYVVPIKRKIS